MAYQLTGATIYLLKREKEMYQPEGLTYSSRRSRGAKTSGKRVN